ncbi:SERTA domain-containing protein 4 [Scleropages formosus]|uniref:SERTA domain containing 4 n=1 Tax=Scleropages formosus TaxID=113540 RepID=A0A8C9QX51_SCLFO|nr:SERTA domain-containing protein 4 [Scleropages formosus]
MTLVLSMNLFCEHAASEGEPTRPPYHPIWESERCSKSCVSSPSPLGCAVEDLAEEPHCRRPPDHVVTSRVSYFKRKFVDDEEPPFNFRSYCQTVAPVLEERAHVLRLSLEKMRFIDDPEAFLRRSVLVNNLLRRLRAEILLQSEWCFPPGPAPGPGPSPSLGPTPMCPWEAPQGPFRKRFRLIRGEAQECLQACCCFYGGRYLRLPFSVYEDATTSSPSPSSSSSPTTPFCTTSSPSFSHSLPMEGQRTRLDSLYPGLEPPEAREAAELLEPKERALLRERVAPRDGERGKGTVASHSRWGELRPEPSSWGLDSRKL